MYLKGMQVFDFLFFKKVWQCRDFSVNFLNLQEDWIYCSIVCNFSIFKRKLEVELGDFFIDEKLLFLVYIVENNKRKLRQKMIYFKIVF